MHLQSAPTIPSRSMKAEQKSDVSTLQLTQYLSRIIVRVSESIPPSIHPVCIKFTESQEGLTE
jgi:hypothetical protein